MGFSNSGAMTGLGLVTGLFWVVMTVFWVIVAWRGLRALEGIERALSERIER